MKIKTTAENLSTYKLALKIEEATCQFLKEKGYLKLDLPVLSPALIPESYLEAFETQFSFFNKFHKLYLTPSPELFIKRLLTEGVGNCYYLGKAFRNSEPSSSLHLSEFTILEFYKTKANYQDIKKEIEKLIFYISQAVFQKETIVYKNYQLNLKNSWEEISVAKAFLKFANIKTEELFDQKRFFKKAQKKGYTTENSSYIDLFSQIYTQEIEPNLGVNGCPTVIYDYPKELAALAELNPDGRTAQRFEFYMAGVELGDCYTELTDWQEQKKRFEKEMLERKKTKKSSYPADWEFIKALKKGLPQCSGIAIGFDRLSMIFANCDNIKNLRLINIE